MILDAGNANEFKRLIENGANIDHQNKYGDSALILASVNGNTIDFVKHMNEK